MEGKHSVHLLLILSKAVENAACRGCVKETHGTGDNLRGETKKKSSLSAAQW